MDDLGEQQRAAEDAPDSGAALDVDGRHDPSARHDQSANAPITRHLLNAIGIGVLFVIPGFLLSLRAFAVVVTPHILKPGIGISYQELTDGLPISHLLNWNQTYVEVLGLLTELPPAYTMAAEFGLAILAWALIATALNPTFHVIEMAHEGPASPAAMTPPRRYKSPILFIMWAAPLAVIWRFLDTVDRADPNFKIAMGTQFADGPGLRWAAWTVLATSTLWLAFRSDGFAGDLRVRRLRRPGAQTPRLLAVGAAFGVCALASIHIGLSTSLRSILTAFQTLGTFNVNYADEIAWEYIGSACIVAFAIGTLAYAAGRPSLPRSTVVMLLALPVAATGCAALVQYRYSSESLRHRFDLTPSVARSIRFQWNPNYPGTGVPEGVAAGHELAVRVNAPIAGATPRRRTLVLFRPDNVAVVTQDLENDNGLAPDVASTTAIERYLAQHDFESSLSNVAFRQLFTTSLANFDTTSALSSIMLDLERCPHSERWSRTARLMFFICDTSDANLALLNQYADASLFLTPDRESKRVIAALYGRFGMVDRQLAWLRRADMPNSYMNIVKSTPPLFHAGSVSGVLTLNGAPLGDTLVGVVPKRLNALPIDLEVRTLEAERDVMGSALTEMQTFVPVPSRIVGLRWLSAGTRTDASGAFQLDHLTEGEYYLLIALPDSGQPPPTASTVHAANRPKPIALNYGTPTHDLGAIALRIDAGSGHPAR